MKASILYHPQSDHAGLVEDYSKEYKRFKNKDLELLSLETVEGSHLAELYDVTTYPALLVRRDDGQLVKIWQGVELPSQNQVEAYAQS